MKIKKIINYIKKAINYLKKYGLKKFIKHYKEKIKNLNVFSSLNGEYKEWIKNNEPNEKELEKQRKYKFKINPKISIVIPMYNTNEKFFHELINCIKNQTYENYEVCLADGSEKINEKLTNIFKDDGRFVYKHLNRNEGISENSNEALKMATGDFIALVDHDDLLPEFALYEIVKVINENEDVEFIYSDEDIIDDTYTRKNPHFKPDFSFDTLNSYNYICHLSVFKKELLEKIGNFRKEYDGAQDYDLILRATEKANKIIHISKMLYHWRAHQNSTAANTDSKLYTREAGKKALEEHLKRLNLKGKVIAQNMPGTYKIEYEINENPKVSILIPNKDGIRDLEKCINSIIKKSTYENYEIIIIENNSEKQETFKFYETLESNKKVKIIKYEERGFNYSKINNYGRKYATGEYLILLNNDIEVIKENWIEEMLGICQRKDVGIVGAKLLYYDNTVQHAGVIIGMGGIAGHINKEIKDSDPRIFFKSKYN